MRSSASEPGITWRGVAIDLVVQVRVRVRVGVRVSFRVRIGADHVGDIGGGSRAEEALH